ncbi:golgin subfamily A member 2-like isoform X2 [Dysidea avara]|uniref:golgin subfamily A member 2-like isoform X2 n=1 Tax=Dysidea avara TaxID=196820 RepID=UPI00331BE478
MNKEEKLKAGNKLFRKYQSKSATKLKTGERATSDKSLSVSMSKELNGMLSQPLRYHNSSPTFLSGGDYSMETTNSHHSLSDTNLSTDLMEEERKLWAAEKKSFQQQIQAHTETMNMLVSEKSSLQAQLNHLQTQLSDKIREHSKSQTELRTYQLQLKTADEEKGQLSTKRSRQEEEMKSLSQQLAQTQHKLQETKYSLDESKQENAEMTSKLTLQAAELLQVQTANAELQAKLNMAELLTQQLSGGGVSSSKSNPSQDQKIQKLTNELEQTKSNVQRVTTERDRALNEVRQLSNTIREQQEQYNQQCMILQQQCAQQQEQLKAAVEKISYLQSEKDTSLAKSSSQLSELQVASQTQEQQLQHEILQLKEQLQQQVLNNSHLSKLNTEQEAVVTKLEGQLSRMKEQSVDNQQLLHTITNDKETISRTVLQNSELKKQLTELQEGFVKMSHQNMELTSELHSEQHKNKQLMELCQKEQEANSQLSQQLISVGDEMKQQHQQQEQSSSHDTTDFMGDLSNEDEGLTFSLPPAISSTPSPTGEQEVLRQVQAERDALAARLDALTEEHSRIVNQQQDRTELDDDHNQTTGDGDSSSTSGVLTWEQLTPQNFVQLQNNFAALQERFTQLMTEKADLLDQLQQYEHVNIQLASETETIGEYIVLYQTQRESLKKKFDQKDRFITQLIQDKETLQGKLTELQDLVKRLVNERQSYQPVRPHSVALMTHELDTSDNHNNDLETSKASTPESPPDSLQNTDTDDTTIKHTTNSNTAHKILTLLQEIESDSSHHHQQLIIPCHCCVGELISV